MLFHQGVIDIWLSTYLQCGRETRQGEAGCPEDVEETHVAGCMYESYFEPDNHAKSRSRGKPLVI